MTDIIFLRPDAIWTALVAVVAMAFWHLIRRRRFVAFSAVSWLDRLPFRASPVRRLPALMIAASLGFIVIALMEPVLPFSESQVHSQGLDIILVLDLSSSMQEVMDLKRSGAAAVRSVIPDRIGSGQPTGKTRLDTTKDALRDFIKHRRDDRIGLIVFSDNAYVVSPLTFDYEYLQHYVDMVDDQILRGEGMTAIGDGIGLANYVLARQSTEQRRNKVVVVFTDGENNFGRDPIDALSDSDAAQIRVHVIGVDLEEEVKQKPAVRRLIDTVRRNGGHYYSADTAGQLRSAYRDIDSLEKGSLTSKAYVRNTPVYAWFALPGLLLVLAGLALRAVPYFADFT